MAGLAAAAELDLEAALDLSLERLTLMSRHKRRRRAAELLQLGQLIVAGINKSREGFSSAQKRFLEQMQ